MQSFNVGPDELDFDDDDGDYKWIVIDYENGGYDGSGDAVALGNDGFLYLANLGHCSCYGPEDGLLAPERSTIQSFFQGSCVLAGDCSDKVAAKVLELLLEELPEITKQTLRQRVQALQLRAITGALVVSSEITFGRHLRGIDLD